MTAGGTPEDEAGAAGWSLAEVRIRPASALAIVAAVVGAIVARNVFVAAHRTIGWAFAAALLAILLLPVVERLDRHLPRALALVVVVLGFALVTGSLWASARHQIIVEAERIKVDAPKAAADLESQYSWAERADLTARVDDAIARFETPSTGAEVSEAAGTAIAYFVPGVLTLFLMIYGPRMAAGAVAQLPEERRPVVRRVLRAAVVDARIQVGYAAVEALVVGGVIGGAAAVFGLPAPVLLGLIAGLLSVFPLMGAVIGALPAVLLALAFESVTAALVILALALAAEVVDALLVRPRVRARAGDVGPALIVIVTLLAFDLYGLGGALYGFIALVFAVALLRQFAIERDGAAS